MINGKSIVAIIPARSGSKGLPGKNSKNISGKPLIAWSVEQGLASKYVDRVIVSTDDVDIAEIARKYGAEVPFLRPSELAEDNSKSIDVILHALEFLENQGERFDSLVLLEPTSPLRDIEDIDQALELLYNHKGAKSIVGVAKVESTHPKFLSTIQNGFLVPYLGKNFSTSRRQELDDVYFFEGSLYASYCSVLIQKESFYHSSTIPFVVPKFKSYEIDEMSDFLVVESLMAAKQKGDIR